MLKCEIRADDTLHIEGYVNAVERDSLPLIAPNIGKCVEQIRAGAFGAALASGAAVEMLENHDPKRKLGSTADGTLTLAEDSIGLRASADIADKDIIDKAKTGQLKGWSFGFTTVDYEVEKRADNIPRRIVKALKLSEVSLIDGNFKPCYPGTLVEVRADGMTEFRSDEEIEITDNSEQMTAAPDYSYYERCIRLHELEMRYNPYHDPSNGRFASGGGGGGNVIYVAKGNKGQYAEDKKEYGKDIAVMMSNPENYFKVKKMSEQAMSDYRKEQNKPYKKQNYEEQLRLSELEKKWSGAYDDMYDRYRNSSTNNAKVTVRKGLKFSLNTPEYKVYKQDRTRYHLQGQMSFEGLR